MKHLLLGSRELWALRGPGLGHTALHWAAAHDDTATLNWLLVQHGADVNTRNNVGATAVHAAAGNNAVASLRILAVAGADMRACDDADETARDVAMRLKRSDALAFLDAAAESQAATVVRNCEQPVASSQQAASATIAYMSRPPPEIVAVARPETETAGAFEGPPDVGEVDKALGRRWLEAARSGDVRSLSELLNMNPRLLYYWGAGTNYGFSGHSALHWAAAKGHTLAVQTLLRAGAHPDIPNHGGGRPLHAAAANGQTECARILILQGGASTSLRNGLDESPRELALQSNHTDTANAIEAAARAAQLRSIMTAAAHELRGAAIRAAQAALVAYGRDMRVLTERDDVFAAAKQLVASLPPLLRHSSELVAVPLAKPAASAVPPAPASMAVLCADADEADASPTARSKLANAAKARGNSAFSSKEYGRATAAYTVALRFDRGNAVLFSNRSAALAALGKYAEALEDAERAVRAAPNWGKGYARRGAALIGLGQAGEAVKAYAAGLAVEPEAAYIREGLAEAKQAIREAQARYSAMWGDQPRNEQRDD
jgi:tetratricopeptide (TPR) repeat protein